MFLFFTVSMLAMKSPLAPCSMIAVNSVLRAQVLLTSTLCQRMCTDIFPLPHTCPCHEAIFGQKDNFTFDQYNASQEHHARFHKFLQN